MDPILSSHFQSREPSSIRLSQIEFLKRHDKVQAVNTAIGNVSLPMHPAMTRHMNALDHSTSPFKDGVVKYTTTVGEPACNQAILHLISSSGFDTSGLYAQTTDGGTMAMELMFLGICGPAGSDEKPLLIMDPTYSNYFSIAERLGRKTISLIRNLEENGKFTLPTLSQIEALITKEKPGGLLVIPYDNPSGQFYDQNTLIQLAKLSVKHNLWMVSDEAYREMFYNNARPSSIWGLTEKEVPGITGRRISIESASKIWSACGLRIGHLVTDNKEFHERSVAEYTANLCANAIGQYVFSALLNESKEDLQMWFHRQRTYYSHMANQVTSGLKEAVPGLIVSKPDASFYTVVDFRNIMDADFDVMDFALFCARKGKVNLRGIEKTLLMAPMDGFYSSNPNPGRTQMRIAYVEPPDLMAEVPTLFAELLKQFNLRLN